MIARIALLLPGLRVDTPLETYTLSGRTVYVKRDDLMGDGQLLAPWGKIEALYELVKHTISSRQPFTHLSVDGSWSGWTLAAIAARLGLEFNYAYPDSKKISRQLLTHVADLYPQTHFYPMKPNFSAIVANRLRIDARDRGWQTLPHGFNHPFFTESLAARLASVMRSLTEPIEHLVVSSGTGVSLSALLHDSIPHVFSTCVSSERTVRKCAPDARITIRKSEFAFDDRMDDYTVPFPCNQFWDAKQWRWLEQHITEFDGNVLFWNLGGRYTF